MKKILSISLLLLLGGYFFQSCQNDEEDPTDRDFTASQDYSLASNLFENTQAVADDAESGGNNYSGGKLGGNSIVGPCASITFDTINNVNRIVIDFGDTNCLGGDNNVRRGKFIITYNGRYIDAGTVITHSFEDFFINDHQVKGTKTVENKGLDQNQDPYFIITVSGVVVKPNGTDSITFNSNRVRTWIAGDSTVGVFPWVFDDKYQITGNGTGLVEFGTASNGIPYSVTITKALIIELPCPWIREGTIQIVPQGGSPRVVDYGDGTCDRKATVSFLGRNYDVII